MRKFTIRTGLAIVFLAHIATVSAAEPPIVTPEGPVWDAGSGFSFSTNSNDSRRSLSGIACPQESVSPHRCVAVFDEGVEARYVVLNSGKLAPESDPILLLAGGKELDAEGAARDGSFIYIVGSHSVKRNNCQDNPDGRHVLRFQVDPATGLTQRKPSGVPSELVDDGGRLWQLITEDPELNKFAGGCLGTKAPSKAPTLVGKHGVNIEGVAARNGFLYFGFREPALNGSTPILRVAADPLFAGGPQESELLTFAVGPGRGIRDLLAVTEGMLLLIGPDDDSSTSVGWSVAFWDGSGARNVVVTPRTLAHLVLPSVRSKSCDKEAKLEALTMLEDGTEFRRLLILSDGMCDGGAVVYQVPK